MMSDKKILPFQSKGGKDPDVVDHGTIGCLNYKIYKRGVIHIFGKDRVFLFKKDPDAFEDAVDKLNTHTMKEGDIKVIEGSGDNDNLVFTCVNGDLELKLQKRGYPLIQKLRDILRRGQKEKIKG